MLHDVGISEVVPQGKCALNPGVGQGADFFAVETAPLTTVEFRVKIENKFSVYEINKSIADIA